MCGLASCVWSPGLSYGIVGTWCIVGGGHLRENQSTRLSQGALKSVPRRDTSYRAMSSKGAAVVTLSGGSGLERLVSRVVLWYGTSTVLPVTRYMRTLVT